MKIKFFLLEIFACAVLFFGWQTSVSAQSGVRYHVVERGETLYKISKKYGVTVDLLLRHNPGVTASTLSTGKRLAIPTIGGEAATASVIHKVKKGETAWSIAQRYNLTVEELAAANPTMKEKGKKLRKGTELVIPAPKVKTPEPVVAPLPKGLDLIRVAVVLPLKSEGMEASRCIEYYRGLLMAVENLKAKGKNIEIHTYNEPAPGKELETLKTSLRNCKPHLLVGPVYSEHFQPFADFSRKEGVKMAVPFSSKVPQISVMPNLFLVNAPDADKYCLAADFFAKTFASNVRVIVVKTSGHNERAFTNMLSSRLEEQGYSVSQLSEEFTDEELKAQLSTDRPAVVVPDASDLASLSRLLPRLTKFRADYPGYQLSLFGYPEWQTYPQTTLSAFHSLDTYIFSNFYYNSLSAAGRSFESNYRRWFKTPLQNTFPRMALLGYDSGLSLMGGMLKHGDDYAGQPALNAELLQSDIRFSRTSETGGFVNQCLWLIHYKHGGVIERLSMQ